jgi:tetratricopeptide (TPR) repeat protein
MKDTKKVEDLKDELEDTFDENTDQSNNTVNTFVQKNGKIIIILSATIIILVGLILLFRSNSEKNETNAMKALARIESYYLQGELENALFAPDSMNPVRGEKIIGLIKIVNEYGSTKAGARATLFAADAHYQLGKFSEAKIYYEKAIQSKIDEIKIGGYAGVASCNEKDGKLKDAAANYLKAVKLISDEGLQLRYLYFAGLCSEKAGDKDAAKKLYRQMINLNKFSEFNNMAKAGIIRLGEDIE